MYSNLGNSVKFATIRISQTQSTIATDNKIFLAEGYILLLQQK